jgi:ribosomal protein L16 Arg81 hydroxylase
VTTRTRSTRTPARLTPPVRTSELERIVAPTSADEFLAAFWERQPLAVSLNEEGRFDDLLSQQNVERLVCDTGLRYPAFRLVKAGEQIALGDYTTDVPWSPQPFSRTADVHRVLAEFEAGATIVLQGLHYNWRPLAEFCRGLEATLGHPVQANAYYTPRGSQGLPVHHDTHDVFVLQVTGHKRWLVYNPVFELPLREQRYKAELGAPGDPVHDLTLAAGDVLYLPRGWMHEALTSDADSLHITVGVNVYSWIDAVRAAVDSCADDIDFRRSVPADGEQPVDLLEVVRERLAAESVSRRMRSRLVRSRRAVLGGQLGQLRALDHLTADTELRRRPTVIADLERGLDGAALVFEGKRISFPAQADEAVAFAATAEGTFRAGDMPGDLDEPGRLVLVRRLVREGFLLVNATPPDAPEGRTGAHGTG